MVLNPYINVLGHLGAFLGVFEPCFTILTNLTEPNPYIHNMHNFESSLKRLPVVENP